MDKLDKILIRHLPDTGLCARGKAKQVRRRASLKRDILSWLQPVVTIHNPFIVHFEDINPNEITVIDEQHLKI